MIRSKSAFVSCDRSPSPSPDTKQPALAHPKSFPALCSANTPSTDPLAALALELPSHPVEHYEQHEQHEQRTHPFHNTAPLLSLTVVNSVSSIQSASLTGMHLPRAYNTSTHLPSSSPTDIDFAPNSGMLSNYFQAELSVKSKHSETVTAKENCSGAGIGRNPNLSFSRIQKPGNSFEKLMLFSA